MRTRLLLLLLAVVLLMNSPQTYAQTFSFKWDNLAAVSVNGKSLQNPWAGGLNSAQYSKMHLNNDDVEDLVLFDRAGGNLLAFLAVPKGNSYVWQHSPRYETLFPANLQHWLLLADYDKDGRKDLFTSTIAGIRVFKNVATENGFSWQLIADPLMTDGFSGNINLYVQSTDLPAITDLDDDGDLDILAFDFSGNSVEYHQNLSVERGSKQPFAFKKMTTCWGGFWKEHCNDFKLNQDCGPIASAGNGRVAHAGNALWAGDLNGDGLKDLLHGHVTCTNISLLTNGNNNSAGAVMKGFSKDFPAQNPVNFTVFPAVYVEDLDFDGQKDLVASPSVFFNEGGLVNMQQSNWLYRNEGSPQKPLFTYKQADFLQDNMLDLGENAAPVLADYDGDGDNDLFVGYAGLRGTQGYRASVWFFKNVGTRTKAAFELVSTDFLGMAEKLANAAQDRVLVTNVKPFFADVNNDGTLDFGYSANTFQGMELRYIPNTAARGQAMQLDVNRLKKLPKIENFVNGEIPFIYDIDADERADVLVGKSSGNVEFHRNVGTTNEPVYELKNEFWGGFSVDFEARSFAVADLNGDRKPELLAGGQFGTVKVFQNFTNPNAVLKADSSLIFNEFRNKTEFVRLNNGLVPALGDLDGDQLPDLLMGTRTGGVVYLKNTSPFIPPMPDSENDFVVYPNPAGNFVYVRTSSLGSLQLFSVTGQLLKESAINSLSVENSLQVSDLAVGLYFVRFTALNGSKATRKVIVNR